MYLAKEGGKGRAERFQPGMQATITNRFALKADLARALEGHQFVLAYQPIANIGTDRLVGVEALVRWHHPTRGVIQPLEFISVAEQTGMMEPLGRWILETACRQMRTWLDAGAPADTHMAVNVSPRQLAHPEFAADVRDILARSNLPARNLILEITEGVLLDPDIALTVLVQLKALGLRIAIDDFGTGYSAMSYLARFPIDILKIDRSFISAIGRETHGDSVVQTILSLAQSFNLETIAEGIEDGDQLNALRQLGCVFGQGFLLGHPVDADELERRLLPSRSPIPRRDAAAPAVVVPALVATADQLG
jgi:EAL domain-containing protein (putative c-di-GMP-specific phosphodiesterase class I)